MRIRRTCLHILAAALTWSAVFALYHAFTLQRQGSDSTTPAVDPSLGISATAVRGVTLTDSEIRSHELILAQSSDGGAICESALELYPQYICEIGHQAALDRMRRHLARNPHLESFDLRSSSLQVDIRKGHQHMAMLYTVTPPCSPVPSY